MKYVFRKPVLISLIGIFAAFTCLLVYLQWQYPTVSPLTAVQFYLYSRQHPHTKLDKETIAFLPYWRIEDTQFTRYNLLSEIIYFSLTLDGKGNIVKRTGNETEPGWRWWNSQKIKEIIAKTQITGGKFSVTLAVLKNDHIELLLDSEKAQQKFTDTAISLVKERRLDGINLDIEYVGDPGNIYRNKFSRFIGNFSTGLKKAHPSVTLSADFLPTAARYKTITDFKETSSHLDRIILMTYDYYTSGSETAGPVAPLTGYKENKYFYDVTTTILDYEKYFPKNKIILGIPYYGWDWPVELGSDINSKTLERSEDNGYPAVLSYGRMREFKELRNDQCLWDEFALSPWCWYTDEEGIDHQVWYENEKSIDVKFDLVNKQQLAGIAIWTLGYDKQYAELWELLESRFGTK